MTVLLEKSVAYQMWVLWKTYSDTDVLPIEATVLKLPE